MDAFISHFLQFHWLPFLGVSIFAVILFFEYRSNLGIFSPSGLVSLYSFIKFFMECLLVVNFSSTLALANVYGVYKEEYLSQAILISFLVSSFSYLLLWLFSSQLRASYLNFFGRKFRNSCDKSKTIFNLRVERISFKYLILFFSGLFLLLVIFQSAGGIYFYINNFSGRTEMLAGYGAVVKFSTLFIQLAVLYFFVNSYKSSPRVGYVILFLGVLVLFSLGGRTAPLFLIFCALVFVHFYYKKFTITLKIFLFLIPIFLGALYVSILRFGDYDSIIDMKISDVPFNLWFSIVGGYFSYIIRDSVIIGYFSENEFWHGSGLLSFLFAFIPRALYPAKPVIDNGVYVIAMSNGQSVIPPMVPGDLPHYGWPESYMSGYMEAGWLGLAFGVLLSCILVSLIFSKLVRSNFRVEWVFLYCFFMFRQPLYLTSVDSFNIVFHIIFVLGLSFIIRRKFVLK